MMIMNMQLILLLLAIYIMDNDPKMRGMRALYTYRCGLCDHLLWPQRIIPNDQYIQWTRWSNSLGLIIQCTVILDTLLIQH